MGLRGVFLWPVYRLSGWVDAYPLSAVGALLFVGALIVLLVSVGVSVDFGAQMLVYDGVTPDAIAETVLAQPAYAIAAALGLVMVLFYDG